jgi:hypothetical protein
MIERYTIKSAPAIPHRDILKKLDEIKDEDTEALRKLQCLRVKVELECEAGDLKKAGDFLKRPSRN